jgi:hypothetical protein
MVSTLLVSLICQPAALRFSAPSVVGEDYFATGFAGFGDLRHALGKAEDGWHGTADGGATWSKLNISLPKLGPVVLSADGLTLHDLGSVADVPDRKANYTSFNSSFYMAYSYSPDPPSAALGFTAENVSKAVVFRGLPQPATCGGGVHDTAFGCPFRTHGRGSVRLSDGTLVMSIVIYWGGAHANPDPELAQKATSVVVSAARLEPAARAYARAAPATADSCL